MSEQRDHVETMIQKASDAPHADEAMKFSQAALNAANAMMALSNISNA